MKDLSVIGSPLIILVIGLVHFDFVDQWFGTRGGLRWFWVRKLRFDLITLSRAAFVLSVLLALFLFVGPASPIWFTVFLTTWFAHQMSMLLISNHGL